MKIRRFIRSPPFLPPGADLPMAEIEMAGLVFLYTTIAFGSALIYFAYH